MNEKINYDGVKFGMLTVLKDGKGLYEGKKKRRSVICKCDCGSEKEVLLRNIKKGGLKSCGCLALPKIEVGIGDVYNHWTVLGEAPNYKSPKGETSRAVFVKCVCSKEKSVLLNTLVHGGSKSCGCQGIIHEEKIKKEKIIPTDTEEEIWTSLFSDSSYLVSSLGRLYSILRDVYMKPKACIRIRSNIFLSSSKEIYKSFYGDYDSSKYILIHLDSDRKNNKLDNLYLSRITDNGVNWVTRLKTNLSYNRKGFTNNISSKNIVEQYNKQQGLSYFLKIPMDITMKDKLASISIDRVDNDKGYAEDNFKLVTRFENMGRNINSFEVMEKFVNENLAYIPH